MWFQQFRKITLIEFILFLLPRSDFPNMSSFWLFHQSRHFLASQLVSSAVQFSSVYFPSIFWLMLQYSSQILKHLCDFPSPMLIWVCSHFNAPKYARSQHWGGRGAHLSENMRTRVWRVNVRNLEKIQDKWLLFQRFVTSIVGYRLYRLMFTV